MSYWNTVFKPFSIKELLKLSIAKWHQHPFFYFRPMGRELVARSYKVSNNVNNFLNVLSVLFAKQCNALAAQRIRRAIQISILLRNLGYDRNSIRRFMERMGTELSYKLKGHRKLFLFSAALFSWEKEKITDQEIKETADTINEWDRNHIKSSGQRAQESNNKDDGWHKIIDRGQFCMWRKPVPNSYLFEYKVCGSYEDVSARAFFNAQVDVDYRKQWDKLIIKLDVIDRDTTSGSEVVHWIMHYPYPMYGREYVYTRRCTVDREKGIMVIVSRSTDHPSCPRNDQYVRVELYQSKLVIRPHTSFDDDGFDYVLTYYDDPKSAFPTFAYNWMANTGVPDFVEKMHVAAQQLQSRHQHLWQGDDDGEKQMVF